MRAPALLAIALVVLACRPRGPSTAGPDEASTTTPPAAEPATTPVPEPPADAVQTASGLRYRVVELGRHGDPPRGNDAVVLRYAVRNRGGTVVARSPSNGDGEQLELAGLPAGWREGLELLAIGSRAQLWLPAALGYGEGTGLIHGPLYVELELVDVVRGSDAAEADLPITAPPPGARTTASGIAYVVIREGTGTTHPGPGAKIRAHYSGWTADGKPFDSSYARGEPIDFRPEQVITGWGEALALMVVGEKTRFWIPEALAYKGKPGRPAGTLTFDIELLSFEP